MTFFFCSRSNFRAITRLETPASQVSLSLSWLPCLMVSSPRSKLAFLPPRNDQQLLSLGYISRICSSLTTIIVYVPSKATKEKSPKLQHIAPFFISQSSFCKLTDDQNNEKPRRDGQKIFLDPWFEHSFPWVAFLTYSQNFSFVGIHKYWFNRWSKMVSVEFHFARTRASRTGNKEVNKWCERHVVRYLALSTELQRAVRKSKK